LSSPKPSPDSQKIKLGISATFRLLDNIEMNVKKIVPPTGINIGTNIKSSTFANYVFDKAYTSGTQFQFFCDVKESAYVYVLASDYEEVVNRAFPLDNSYTALIPYGKSQFVFPSPDHYLYLDEHTGKEFICFLLSHKEIDLDKLIQKMKTATGDFNEKIKSALGNRLLDSKNSNYSSAKIDFEVSLDESSDKVAVLLVELNHN